MPFSNAVCQYSKCEVTRSNVINSVKACVFVPFVSSNPRQGDATEGVKESGYRINSVVPE
ncbi:hypothetical protein J6590_035044 [Homalodisca vitripennis]|nr:hypothetical protein J6590_035044 [Homalodisca vitripennis]